jgi:hypothetical protein
MDRVHDEAGLHAHGRAVAGIHPLHLARDEAIADVIDGGAAVVLRQGRAEEPEFAHLGHDLAVEAFVAVGLENPRHQLFLAVIACRVAHHALVFIQLLFEQEGGP